MAFRATPSADIAQCPATFSMLQTATGFLIRQALFATTMSPQSSGRRCFAIGISIDRPEDDPERRYLKPTSHTARNLPARRKIPFPGEAGTAAPFEGQASNLNPILSVT
jgi:hypothetical protein